MSMHAFITNLVSIVVPKRDGAFDKKTNVARSRQLWTARTSQMLTARTDCTGSHHFAQPIVQPVMQPRGEAQPGATLFTHWATWVWLCQQDMGVVAPRGHGICNPLGHPGGEPQPHHFEWRINVFAHAPHLCMPPMSKLACVVAGGLCVLVHVDRNWCGCPVLLHLIMEHTCMHTLGLCG